MAKFCSNCGNQLSDTASFCPKCGSQQMIQNSKKKNKKSPVVPIVCAVLAVALVSAAVTLGFVYFTSGSREKLEKKLGKLTDKKVIEFYYDDFNSDDVYEAFAVVGKGNGDDFSKAEIWFISDDAGDCVKDDIENGRINGILEENNQKYISVEVEDEENDTEASFVYGVEAEDEYVEPEISGKYQNVQMKDGKIVCTDEYGEEVEISINIKNNSKEKQTSDSEKPTEAQWREAYKQDLQKFCEENPGAVNDDESTGWCGKCYLVNIDDDDVPELLLTVGGFHYAAVDIYSYYDGKSTKIGTFGSYGNIMYISKTGRILASNGGSGCFSTEIHELKNHEFTKLWSGFEDMNSNPDNVEYRSNDKKVSESQFNSDRDRYFDSDKAHAIVDEGIYNMDLRSTYLSDFDSLKVN